MAELSTDAILIITFVSFFGVVALALVVFLTLMLYRERRLHRQFVRRVRETSGGGAAVESAMGDGHVTPNRGTLGGGHSQKGAFFSPRAWSPTRSNTDGRFPSPPRDGGGGAKTNATTASSSRIEYDVVGSDYVAVPHNRYAFVGGHQGSRPHLAAATPPTHGSQLRSARSPNPVEPARTLPRSTVPPPPPSSRVRAVSPISTSPQQQQPLRHEQVAHDGPHTSFVVARSSTTPRNNDQEDRSSARRRLISPSFAATFQQQHSRSVATTETKEVEQPPPLPPRNVAPLESPDNVPVAATVNPSTQQIPHPHDSTMTTTTTVAVGKDDSAAVAEVRSGTGAAVRPLVKQNAKNSNTEKPFPASGDDQRHPTPTEVPMQQRIHSATPTSNVLTITTATSPQPCDDDGDGGGAAMPQSSPADRGATEDAPPRERSTTPKSMSSHTDVPRLSGAEPADAVIPMQTAALGGGGEPAEKNAGGGSKPCPFCSLNLRGQSAEFLATSVCNAAPQFASQYSSPEGDDDLGRRKKRNSSTTHAEILSTLKVVKTHKKHIQAALRQGDIERGQRLLEELQDMYGPYL